jgi:hypothetical protein
MTITPLIGAKAYLIFEGDAITAAPTDTTLLTTQDPTLIETDEWRSLGCISANDFQNLREGEVKTYCVGTDGAQTLRNTKYTQYSSQITITLEDLTVDAWRLVFGVNDFDGALLGTPGSQTELPVGYLKLQNYDNTGDASTANVANMDVWCEFDVNSATTFDKNNQTQLSIQCNILPNVFNSVKLLNSATTDSEGA